MKTLDKGQDKIQKICNVLRQETIEPAQKQAETIVAEAKERAHKIQVEAEKEAEKLHEDARAAIEKEKNVFDSSLSQAVKQSLETLRQEVETALEYQRRIEARAHGQRPGALRDRLENTADQLSDWINNVYKLALRLDAYRQDRLLAQERETVPQEIEKLAARRRLESDPAVQRELNEVLESKGKQWQMLRALDTRMQQAELQLEQSMTALATVHSQVQLIDARDVDSGRSGRLEADIREQVERLNDLISSINEISEEMSGEISNI